MKPNSQRECSAVIRMFGVVSAALWMAPKKLAVETGARPAHSCFGLTPAVHADASAMISRAARITVSLSRGEIRSPYHRRSLQFISRFAKSARSNLDCGKLLAILPFI
jgi:hypothetical protein